MTAVLVIGGGPAGITAAFEASLATDNVTLVCAEPVGGRANWYSLTPSKVYLTAADYMQEAFHFPAMGLDGYFPGVDPAALRARVSSVSTQWGKKQAALLANRGVKVIEGRATFMDEHNVRVVGASEEFTLRFDVAIVATGSEPVFFPELKPDGRRIWAPRMMSKIDEWPAHLVVVGGGVTGAEYAYAFASLGSRVTLVTDFSRLLPRADEDLSLALEMQFRAWGMELVLDCPVLAVENEGPRIKVMGSDGLFIEGSHAFLAIGRQPTIDGLNIPGLGLTCHEAGICVDEYCRTSIPHLYAAGDVTGPPYTVNRAMAQARTAARHATGQDARPFSPLSCIEAVYTRPQVAQVGLTEHDLLSAGTAYRYYRADYDHALKPHLAECDNGFLKILTALDGQILGGAAFGSQAAEILGLVSLALSQNLNISALADHFAAHPTFGELAGIAARGRYKVISSFPHPAGV